MPALLQLLQKQEPRHPDAAMLSAAIRHQPVLLRDCKDCASGAESRLTANVSTYVDIFVVCCRKEGVMRARKIVKWGNSMAVRLPKVVLQDVGLKEGDFLVFSAKNGTVVAKPV